MPNEKKIQKKVYVHCRNCSKDKPKNISSRDWSCIEVALCNELVAQVRCYRCDMIVIEIRAVLAEVKA